MNISLQNRRAVVCGSSQGIGRAVAETLAELGASVTLVARNEAALKRVKSTLNAGQGQSHSIIVVDFSEPEELRQAIGEYVKISPPTHILVNNTGGPPAGRILDAAPADFTAAFSMHIICNHILAASLIPGMRSEGYGRIINIVSTSVRQPISGLGVSNTIRAAVAGWAKTLAAEVGRFGITVNNIIPGYTDTARLQSLISHQAAAESISPDEVMARMIQGIPLGRFAAAADIAYAVAFLASLFLK